MMPRDGFRWTVEPWGRALRSTPMLAVADHFFTTRQLRLRGGSEEADWAAVAATIGVVPVRLLRLHQVHGRRAVVARRGDHASGISGRPLAAGPDGHASTGGTAEFTRRSTEAVVPAVEGVRPEADILVSDDPDVALAIQVADCVPLLVADRGSPAVAAVHAGWRGTAARAAVAATEVLRQEFGAVAEDLVVAQGPSIGACCYEVGDDVVAAFEDAGFGGQIDRWFSRDAGGRLRLDLWAANRDQLVGAGVRADNIHQAGLCTASHPEWFASYRRDGPGTGRIAAVIRARGTSR